LFSGSSHAPPKGPGPNAPQFWGFMHTPFVAELSNLTWEERVYTPPIPIERSYGSQLLGFFCTYSYTLKRRTTKFRMVTSMWRGMFSGGHPRHCICTNASRGLSATAEFLLIALQQSMPNMQLKQLIFPIRDLDIMANL